LHYVGCYSHREAQEVLGKVGLADVPAQALNAPKITIKLGCSKAIKRHVATHLLGADGWASSVKVDASLGPSVNALHASGVAFHVQTGNIARAFYDLMKLQSLYHQRRAIASILAVPTNVAARKIGGNLANFDRVREELESLFSDQVSMPLLLAAFE
jgi:hypothetical protein